MGGGPSCGIRPAAEELDSDVQPGSPTGEPGAFAYMLI